MRAIYRSLEEALFGRMVVQVSTLEFFFVMMITILSITAGEQGWTKDGMLKKTKVTNVLSDNCNNLMLKHFPIKYSNKTVISSVWINNGNLVKILTTQVNV